MDTQEIILPEGWSVDRIEDGKVILKEEDNDVTKLNIWEKCFDKLSKKSGRLQFIDSVGSAVNIHPGVLNAQIYRNSIPQEYTCPMLALMQLLVCYKAWVGDWKPTWNLERAYYSILATQDKLVVASKLYQTIFAFPTKELGERFCNVFTELLEQAKPLL
jgi:hypothetical protein